MATLYLEYLGVDNPTLMVGERNRHTIKSAFAAGDLQVGIGVGVKL